MFRKSGKMIATLTAVAAMAASLAISASAASEPVHLVKADGVDAELAFATEGSANSSAVMVVKADDVAADVVFAGEALSNDGAIMVVKAGGVDADVVFADADSSSSFDQNDLIKISRAEGAADVTIVATDGIALEQE